MLETKTSTRNFAAAGQRRYQSLTQCPVKMNGGGVAPGGGAHSESCHSISASTPADNRFLRRPPFIAAPANDWWAAWTRRSIGKPAHARRRCISGWTFRI